MSRVLFLLCLCLFATPPVRAQSFNAQQQAEIRAVVRDYLVRNPDVLREALNALESRVAAERRQRIESDPRDFSLGPAAAPIVIVEFFDYRCGHCREALEWMNEVGRNRRDVRIIYKELPILTNASMEAARASAAALPQGRYLAFHRALMSFNGELTSARIDELARRSGVDVARMRRRMEDPVSGAQIDAYLNANRAFAIDLAGERGVGTPLFLINGKVVSGFNRADMDAHLREATRAAG